MMPASSGSAQLDEGNSHDSSSLFFSHSIFSFCCKSKEKPSDNKNVNKNKEQTNCRLRGVKINCGCEVNVNFVHKKKNT